MNEIVQGLFIGVVFLTMLTGIIYKCLGKPSTIDCPPQWLIVIIVPAFIIACLIGAILGFTKFFNVIFGG